MKGFAQSPFKLLTIVGIAISSAASHAQVQRIMNRWAAEHAYEKMGTTIVQSSPDDIITHCLPTDRAGDTETCRKEKYDPATRKFVAIGDWYQREDGEIPPAERKTEPGSAGKTTSKVSGFLEGGVPATPEARYRDSMQGAETALVIGDAIDSVVDYAKKKIGMKTGGEEFGDAPIARSEPAYSAIASETRQRISNSNANSMSSADAALDQAFDAAAARHNVRPMTAQTQAADGQLSSMTRSYVQGLTEAGGRIVQENVSGTMQVLERRAEPPTPVSAKTWQPSATSAATSVLTGGRNSAKPSVCVQYSRVYNDIAGPTHGWQESCTRWSN